MNLPSSKTEPHITSDIFPFSDGCFTFAHATCSAGASNLLRVRASGRGRKWSIAATTPPSMMQQRLKRVFFRSLYLLFLPGAKCLASSSHSCGKDYVENDFEDHPSESEAPIEPLSCFPDIRGAVVFKPERKCTATTDVTATSFFVPCSLSFFAGYGAQRTEDPCGVLTVRVRTLFQSMISEMINAVLSRSR